MTPFSLDPLIAEAKRRARRRWLIIALSLALLAGGTAGALALRSVGLFGASDPQAVLGSMSTAALGQHSVHWSKSQMEDMLGEWHVSADVTANSGMERLTIPGLRRIVGSGTTTGKVDIRLVNGVAYVRGTPMGLEWFLVLTDARATRYAGRWISIPKTDQLYAHASDGLTLASLIHNATPDLGKGLKTKVTSGKLQGAGVVVIEEGGPPPGTYLRLSARAGDERLPAAVYERSGTRRCMSPRQVGPCLSRRCAAARPGARPCPVPDGEWSWMRLCQVTSMVLVVGSAAAFAVGTGRANPTRTSTDETLKVSLQSPKLTHPKAVGCALLLRDAKKPVTFNFSLVNTGSARLTSVQLEFATSRGSSILGATPRPQGYSHRSAIWAFRRLHGHARKSFSLTAKYREISSQQPGQFEILATGHRAGRQGLITDTHLQCAVTVTGS